MSSDDREYLQRRRRECMERAENAENPALTHLYRRFAAHYSSALAHHGVSLRLVGRD